MPRMSNILPALTLPLTRISDLRQIPDAQEVFLEQQSDISYIFEILDRVEPIDPREAAMYALLILE